MVTKCEVSIRIIAVLSSQTERRNASDQELIAQDLCSRANYRHLLVWLISKYGSRISLMEILMLQTENRLGPLINDFSGNTPITVCFSHDRCFLFILEIVF